MDLVTLGLEHEGALQAFLADFAEAGEDEIPAYFGKPEWTHADTVEHLAAWTRGERLPEGWVPCTTWVLVDHDEILGVINLRHELTEALRQLGGHVGYSVRPSARSRGHATCMLEGLKAHARALGLDRLLVTCDVDNRASNRVVEKCGGALLDEIGREEGSATFRYWVSL